MLWTTAVADCNSSMPSSHAELAGVADLKGIKLQEEAYLAAARARGDGQAAPFIIGCPEPQPGSLQRQLCEVACAGQKLTEGQPLQSENDKFWAVVEPVALQRRVSRDKAPTYGPQLLTRQAMRKTLLGSQDTRSAMLRSDAIPCAATA